MVTCLPRSRAEADQRRTGIIQDRVANTIGHQFGADAQVSKIADALTGSAPSQAQPQNNSGQ